METIQLLLQLTQKLLWEVLIVINTLFSKNKHNKEDFQNELYLEFQLNFITLIDLCFKKM